jgi:hypothetical protein
MCNLEGKKDMKVLGDYLGYRRGKEMGKGGIRN